MAQYRDVADYIEGLTLTQGRYAGQPFRLHYWEQKFLRGMLSVDGDSALSLARGNGKSTLIAALACAALDGPLMQPHSQVVVAASSFDQGKIVFDHCKAFMGGKLADGKRWRLQDSTNRAIITCRKTGASLRCIGSDPRRMHGLAPRLLIGDELAQWESTKIDRALAALQTSMGKIPSARAVWIGTRAAAPDHPFERILNGGCEYAQVHSTPRDLPPFRKRSWERANPGLKHLPDLELAIRKEAKRARKDPMALASFRALRLDQGVSDTVENLLCTAESWLQAEVEEADRRGDYVLGLDLGVSASLSAACGYWPDSGFVESFAVLPFELDLHSKGLADGVGGLYEVAAERGELLQRGQKVSDIGGLLEEVLRRWGAPSAIVCDTVRRAELTECLEDKNFPYRPVEWRRMGFISQGEDVRHFKAALLDGQVRPLKGLLIRSSVAGARLARDAAGNEKLNKTGAKARDDIACAVVLAVSLGRRRREKAEGLPYAII